MPSSASAAMIADFHRAQVGADVGDVHDRVADELAGPVVGDAPAAVGVDDLDAPARGRSPRPSGSSSVARAPPARVHGRVLEQQQRVGQLSRLAPRADVLLDRKRVGVGHVPRWQTQSSSGDRSVVAHLLDSA